VSETAEEREVREFLEQHLQGIMANDTDNYRETTSPDLSLYEWYIMPHRIDGLDFHYFIMEEAARRGGNPILPASDSSQQNRPHTRFDLCNLRIQLYNDTAIASYTLLQSTGLDTGVRTASHHESRVLIRREGKWQVVHVHKSPAWSAPYMPSDRG
jgi:hypothetical protein